MLQSACTFVIPNSFASGLSFFAGPWAITPENLTTSCCLGQTEVVMLLSNFVAVSTITPLWIRYLMTYLWRAFGESL